MSHSSTSSSSSSSSSSTSSFGVESGRMMASSSFPCAHCLADDESLLAECLCSCASSSSSSLRTRSYEEGTEGSLTMEDVLPVELLHHILSFLPLGDLARSASRTSRLWRSLALDPGIWMPHWRRLHEARPRVELSEGDIKRAVQPPPENVFMENGDPYLVDAGCSLREALSKDISIDWRREYLRRKNFSVLVVTFHTSHSNHYDLDVVRQLRKFGINADICHLMCNHDLNKHIQEFSSYNFVDYDDNLFLKYDTIVYFAAMSGGDALKEMLGNSLMGYLKCGGGVVFCTYTHMKSYQLLGRWTEAFYPMKPSSRTFQQPSKKHKEVQPKHHQHPLLSGTSKRFHIDPTRMSSRFDGQIDPLASVVAEYNDGTPLVIVLDEEANRKKGWEEAHLATDKPDEEPDSDSDDDCIHPTEEKMNYKGQAQWGKTLFLNFFPVSKDDPGTGGWYDWNSDLPLILRNAVLYAARRGEILLTKDTLIPSVTSIGAAD